MSHDAPSAPRIPDPPRPWRTTRDRLAWLQAELPHWQADGLISAEAAAALSTRYTVTHRITVVRLVLGLGAAFTGVGVIWLVAANLDQLSPLLRFALVAALWLAATAVAEVLAHRLSPDEDGPSPLIGVCRLLSAALFGAVVFQAAQSLQVPAFEPRLVAMWGIGALLYAYAVDSRSALVVAIGTLVVWLGWQTATAETGLLGFVVAMLLAATLATAAAALHSGRWRGRWSQSLAGPWLAAATILALTGLFAAALPGSGDAPTGWSLSLTIGAAAAAAAGAAALLLAPDRRVDVAVAVAMLAAGWLIALWQPLQHNATELTASTLTPAIWARTAVSVLCYLAAAGWFAITGARRERPFITAIATAALVVFTTFQSFAVFAPIISGATLFLAVGAVMLGSGILAERARRRLVRGVQAVAS